MGRCPTNAHGSNIEASNGSNDKTLNGFNNEASAPRTVAVGHEPWDVVRERAFVEPGPGCMVED